MIENIEKLWAKIKDGKTLVETMGIEIEHLSVDEVRGSMPVDTRTVQYFGVLHGGASAAFAESLASIGGNLHIDLAKESAVGLELNANHLKSVAKGRVLGVAKPIHIGRKTQVWGIEIRNEDGQLICISRCTLMIVPRG